MKAHSGIVPTGTRSSSVTLRSFPGRGGRATARDLGAEVRGCARRYWFLPALLGVESNAARVLHVVVRGGEVSCTLDGDDGRSPAVLPRLDRLARGACAAALVHGAGTAEAGPVIERLAETLAPNGLLLLGLEAAAARRAWEAALGRHFTQVARFAVLPSLAQPSLLLSDPALIRRPETRALLWPDLTRRRRVLLPVLGRPALIRRFAPELTVWARAHGVPERRWFWPAPAAAIAVYAGKPARAVPRAFLVPWRDGQPLALAKLSREPDAKLAHEEAALRRVHALLGDSPLRDALPAWCLRGAHGYAYEYRAGRSLAERLAAPVRWPWRRGGANSIDRAVAWLIAFQCATRPAVRPAGDTDLPRGPVHGDYQPANLLLGPGGRLSVLDWEHFEEHQVVAYDFLNFLTYVGVFFAGARSPDDACARLFFVRSRLARHLRAHARTYCAALGLRPPALAAAYPGFLAWRMRRRTDEGVPNDGTYLAALARFWDRHAPRACLFDA